MADRTYDAIIFDVDGVIVDSESVYCDTFNTTLGDFGAGISRSDYAVCVGHPVEENSAYAVERYGLDVAPAAIPGYLDGSIRGSDLKPRPGAADAGIPGTAGARPGRRISRSGWRRPRSVSG